MIMDFNKKLKTAGRLVGFTNFLGDDIFGIKENLISGSYILKNNNAIIGSRIKDILGVKINDYIILENSKNQYLGAKVIGFLIPAINN